jgi:hypothetical protein
MKLVTLTTHEAKRLRATGFHLALGATTGIVGLLTVYIVIVVSAIIALETFA